LFAGVFAPVPTGTIVSKEDLRPLQAKSAACFAKRRALRKTNSIELAPELVEERPQIGDVVLKHLSPFL
jgi:hypothetical protein